MVFKKCCITTRTKKNQYTMCTGFLFGAEENLNSNDDDRSQRLKQEELLGPRSDFSKPCQGAAEISKRNP